MLEFGFPDPLFTISGERVTTAQQWIEVRAPELRESFQREEYGRWPRAPADVESKVRREESAALGGAAILREVTLSWGLAGVEMELLLVLPRQTQPAPVILGLSFGKVIEALPGAESRDPAGPAAVEKWNIGRSIERGYAVALFHNADLVPDEPAPAAERLKLFRGTEAPAPDDTATIAAWASGFSRAIDYLVTVAEVDAGRICLVGHSRNGKAALFAGAMDQRAALIIPAQAGCGGTAPCRVRPDLSRIQGDRPSVETLRAINTYFPHWFCENFKRYNDDPAKLPFDQHELIALCAPRPVLISAASEDLWANPEGQFDMACRADPVYRLLTGQGLDAREMPPAGELVNSRLGFFLRAGKHVVNQADWAAWLDYADRWLGR